MRRATIICSELGIGQINFESDAKMVFDALKSIDENDSWHGQVMPDIKYDLSVQPNWKISFTYRE